METQERRERIFAAAEGLLCEQGYERVSMAAIAAAAGMSKKTLYLLFRDKEELVRSSCIWPEPAPGGERMQRTRCAPPCT